MPMLTAVAMTALLTACGGGHGDSASGVASGANSEGINPEGMRYIVDIQAQQESQSTDQLANGPRFQSLHLTEGAALDTGRFDGIAPDPLPDQQVAGRESGTTAQILGTPKTTTQGDAAAPTAILGGADSMNSLGYVGSSTATTSGVGQTATCQVGYVPPASLNRTKTVTAPTNGGMFYNLTELKTWKARVATGPFVVAGDHMLGSPGDWNRIKANAAQFLATGDTKMAVTSPGSDRAVAGTLVRDAAFAALITGDTATINAVRAHVVAEAQNSANQFSTFCFRELNGTAHDAWYFEASWLLRYMVAYDYLRSSFTATEKLNVENFFRRNGYFLAANSDWGLNTVFPQRLAGNYTVKASAAAATTQAEIWWARRYDTNGDCAVDAADSPNSYPAYAYVGLDGGLGPRISVLSQYYNNRRAIAATAAGVAGLISGSPELTISAKRYFMEWLTYGVWSDGSQGELARSGDYCIPQQGIVYSYSNSQGASLLGRVLARQGDKTMFSFTTNGGLFGTEDSTKPKSLKVVVQANMDLLAKTRQWYFYEPWKVVQEQREATRLGNNISNYMNSAKSTDNYHELGLLVSSNLFGVPALSDIVLRNQAVTTLPFPGSSGNAVATGYGVWTDAFNALPAILLLRP